MKLALSKNKKSACQHLYSSVNSIISNISINKLYVVCLICTSVKLQLGVLQGMCQIVSTLSTVISCSHCDIARQPELYDMFISMFLEVLAGDFFLPFGRA